MESPLRKASRARLAQQKAEERVTPKRKRAQKGVQALPLGDRLEKHWKSAAELGKRLALRTREARKDKHRYLAAIYRMYVEARGTDELEALWRRAQPGTKPMPSMPKDIIAGVIRGTYADKELERDTVHQWAQAVCGADVKKCAPGRAYAFFTEGGIAGARETYRAHTRKALPTEAAAKDGGGSDPGPRKPEAHASSAGRKRKGTATSRSGPPLSTSASKASAADGRATASRLLREAVARRAEIVRGAESCLLNVCERYRNGKLIEVKIFEIPQEGKRATRPGRRHAAGRRRSGSSIVANVEAGKRPMARSAI
jgi:hypothetical protein